MKVVVFFFFFLLCALFLSGEGSIISVCRYRYTSSSRLMFCCCFFVVSTIIHQRGRICVDFSTTPQQLTPYIFFVNRLLRQSRPLVVFVFVFVFVERFVTLPLRTGLHHTFTQPRFLQST